MPGVGNDEDSPLSEELRQKLAPRRNALQTLVDNMQEEGCELADRGGGVESGRTEGRRGARRIVSY